MNQPSHIRLYLRLLGLTLYVVGLLVSTYLLIAYSKFCRWRFALQRST